MNESSPELGEPVGTDLLFGGQLRLAQLRSGHRVGTDAVLLAAAAASAIGPGQRFVDAGAGVGAVGLEIARREPGCHGVLLEIDAEAASLAEHNAVLNNCRDRVAIACGDLLDPSFCRSAGLEGTADLVASNPPYYAAGTVRASPDGLRAVAHVQRTDVPLSAWVGRLCDLLAPKGRLVVIHRASAYPALLAALGRGFGSIVLQPICPRAGMPATRILVGAARNSKMPATILAPLTLHAPNHQFTAETDALHRGAPLSLWPQKSRPRRTGSLAATEKLSSTR